MLAWFAKSLRRKVLAVLLIVAGVPALLSFVIAYWGTQNAIERAFGAFWENSASALASRINALVVSCTEEAVGAVRSDAAQRWLRTQDGRPADDDSAAFPIPETMQTHLGIMYRLAVFAPDGTLLWQSGGLGDAFVQQLVNALGPSTLAAAPRVQVSGWDVIPATSPTGEPRICAAIPIAPADDGGMPGIAVVVFEPALLHTILEESHVEGAFLVRMPGGEFGLRDRGEMHDLALLLRDRLREDEQSPLVGRFESDEGLVLAGGGGGAMSAVVYAQIRSLSSLTPGDARGEAWYVTARVDVEGLGAARDEAFWTLVLGSVGLMVLAYALGVWMANRITEPVRLLRNEVRALAAGDLSSRVKVPTSDELDELARDINTMAKRLSETYKNLERSIESAEQRARQLQVMNQITTAMTSALTIDRTFARFSANLQQLGRFEHCSLSLLGTGRSLTHQVSLRSQYVQIPFPDEEILAVIDFERPLHLEERDMAGRTGSVLRSGMVIPLATRSETIGSLNLASELAESFTAELAGDLAFMAEALAAAIQHNRLYEQVHTFAQSLERQVEERTRELQEAQEQLLRVEKFAATGRLAANLAHEINNPLGIIKNHLQLLRDKLRPRIVVGQPVEPSDTERWTVIMGEEIDRIARLTRSLLRFYRTAPEEERMISINRELEEILFLVRETLQRRQIEIVCRLGETIPETYMSPDQARQVFMNLVRNAEDAMEGKPGRITITTRYFPPATDFPLGGIEVIVEDTGKGIPREHMDKIFEPFFTTKGEGKGTGLGLSVTYGIMSSLRGTIFVESEPGTGTRFFLRLPVRREPSERARARASASGEFDPARPPSGHYTPFPSDGPPLPRTGSGGA